VRLKWASTAPHLPQSSEAPKEAADQAAIEFRRSGLNGHKRDSAGRVASTFSTSGIESDLFVGRAGREVTRRGSGPPLARLRGAACAARGRPRLGLRLAGVEGDVAPVRHSLVQRGSDQDDRDREGHQRRRSPPGRRCRRVRCVDAGPRGTARTPLGKLRQLRGSEGSAASCAAAIRGQSLSSDRGRTRSAPGYERRCISGAALAEVPR